MVNPTQLPPTSGDASPSEYAVAVNSWLSAIKASWADAVNPPGLIDGLIQYVNPAGSAPRLRFRRSGVWAGILDDVGREASNLNSAIEGGLRYFGAGAGGTPFSQAGTALVIPRGNGITQIAFRQADADHAYIRSSLDGFGSNWTSWRRIYTQADIVGTVSESGGIPSGAIIESDTLSSGHYVRFADGTQICDSTRTLTYADTTHLNTLWTLPRKFVSSSYRVSLTLRSLTAAPGSAMVTSPAVGDTATDSQLRISLYRIQGQTNFNPSNTAQVDAILTGNWTA